MARKFATTAYHGPEDQLGVTPQENAAILAGMQDAGSSEGNSVNKVAESADTSADAAAGEGTGSSGGEDLYYPSEIANAGKGDGGINHYIQFESFAITTAALSSGLSEIKEKLANGSIKSFEDIKANLPKLARSQEQAHPDRRIALYMPAQVINKIGVNYQTQSFVFIDNLVALGTDSLAGLNVSADEKAAGTAVVASKLVSTMITAMVSRIAAIDLTGVLNSTVSVLGAGVAKELEAAVSRGTGVAINPRLTSLFKNPELRNFSFTFIFSPRSPEEASMVHKIMSYFKSASLPKSFGAASFLNFPNEFRITCKTGGNDNEYMFKTKRCVITNIEVNHTPSALFNAFGVGSHYGMPTQSTLSLNFTETEILTSEDVTSKVAY